MAVDPDLVFEARTPIGFLVRVTKERWELIIRDKHPVMHGQETIVRSALETPDEARQSRMNSSVYLFYKAQKAKRWVVL